VILGSFKASFWIAFIAATILILGAAYTLWMVKRVIFGAVEKDSVASLTDINARETLILTILAVVVLFFGIWPDPLVDVMHTSVQNLLEHVSQSKVLVP
jgi:NADH-quinone oxidoreductase subunit M